MFTAKSIRLFSIFGILMLLVLQYIWFKNSYVLMEQDIITKSESNLSKAIENELFERYNSLSINVLVVKGDENKNPKENIISEWGVKQSKDINIGLQNILISIGKNCSIQRVDFLFQQKIKESIGFVPKHTIKLISTSQKEKSLPSKFTLYAKVTEKQYIQVILNSPLESILRKAQFVLYISVFLVILIGIILITQLRSMLRENRFVSFIKEYTNSLAHDLKTPISGIYMSASQLASGIFEDKPESRMRYYQMCKDQSSKLLTTVDRILLVAKAEHSKIVPNITDTELKPYIDKIVDIRRQNNFRMKSVDLSTSFQSETMMGSFDPFLMENVLNNLIDNAVKYSNNSVAIEILCSIVSSKLQIIVKDNGFGIAKNEQKHIFDNFERGSKIDGKGIDGFGIGLNYVNKVIKAHNGNISVKSEEGQGSEFIILLPHIKQS